ncbi:MAG: hypothetical protein HY077_10060 [Elusimicrobia bacterium]|nr:hypothetical protein [Elusimicrobiota bacterium]
MKILALVSLFALSVQALPPNDRAKREIKQVASTIQNGDATAAAPTTPPEKKDEWAAERPQHLDKIDQIAGQYPKDDQVQATATQAFIDVGEPKRGLPHADQYVALARDSGNPELYNKALQLRANVNFSLKDYPAAARDAQAILKRNPGDPEAKNIFALSAGRGGGSLTPQAPTPTFHYDQPLPADPNRKTMAQILTKAQQNEQMKEAATFHTSALNYIKLGDHKAAKDQLDKALAKAQGNAQLLAMRSKENLALGDKQGALADAKNAVKGDPNLAQAHAALGLALQADGASPEQVRAELAKAKELDPSFTPEYEKALAGLPQNPDKAVDANGVGMAGRNAMGGFNPQTARDQLFGGLPDPVRKFAPMALVALTALVIAGVVWLLGRGSRQTPD